MQPRSAATDALQLIADWPDANMNRRTAADMRALARSIIRAQSGMSEVCQRCGSEENPAWSAPSPLWNAVVRGGSINGEPLFRDMVCATCFMTMAESAGIAADWRLHADRVNVELETVTPSGRVWDDSRQLWTDATLDQPAAEGAAE